MSSSYNLFIFCPISKAFNLSWWIHQLLSNNALHGKQTKQQLDTIFDKRENANSVDPINLKSIDIKWANFVNEEAVRKRGTSSLKAETTKISDSKLYSSLWKNTASQLRGCSHRVEKGFRSRFERISSNFHKIRDENKQKT